MKAILIGVGFVMLLTLIGTAIIEPWLGDAWKDNYYCALIGILGVQAAIRWFGD